MVKDLLEYPDVLRSTSSMTVDASERLRGRWLLASAMVVPKCAGDAFLSTGTDRRTAVDGSATPGRFRHRASCVAKKNKFFEMMT